MNEYQIRQAQMDAERHFQSMVASEKREQEAYERGFYAGMNDMANGDKWHKAGYEDGFRDAIKEAVEWCMAFRRDDGTAQKIEEKLRALKPEGEKK